MFQGSDTRKLILLGQLSRHENRPRSFWILCRLQQTVGTFDGLCGGPWARRIVFQREGLNAVRNHQLRIHGIDGAQNFIHTGCGLHPDLLMDFLQNAPRPSSNLTFTFFPGYIKHSESLSRHILRHLQEQRGFPRAWLGRQNCDRVLYDSTAHHPIKFSNSCHNPAVGVHRHFSQSFDAVRRLDGF